jgi:Transposase
VYLAHPLGVKAFSCRRVKNDALDAWDPADLLRMGLMPEAWIAPAEIRELREITRYRSKLVHIRTSCKDQVHHRRAAHPRRALADPHRPGPAGQDPARGARRLAAAGAGRQDARRRPADRVA